MNVIVGWIVGNTQSGPHSFRKKKPFGWQYSDGLVTQSYHEAEVARLRAELNAATKAGLDAIATICEKEREADALRAEAEGLRKNSARWDWLMNDHYGGQTARANKIIGGCWNRADMEEAIDKDLAARNQGAAMGEGK